MRKINEFKNIISISIIGIILIIPKTGIAADIPIESYVTGGLTLTLQGSWNPVTDITFSNIERVAGYYQDETGYLTMTEQQDYINFKDDSATTGFYMTIKVTDYAYSGSSESQGPLAATIFRLYGEYANGTPATITKGYDDPSKNLSILPNSCAGATTDKFTWHADFSDSVKNYSLQGSNTAKTLITSTVNCLNLGHLRFDRAEVPIPSTAASGNYTNNITITIIDGAP